MNANETRIYNAAEKLIAKHKDDVESCDYYYAHGKPRPGTSTWKTWVDPHPTGPISVRDSKLSVDRINEILAPLGVKVMLGIRGNGIYVFNEGLYIRIMYL